MRSLLRKIWRTRFVAEPIPPPAGEATLAGPAQPLFRRSLNLWVVNLGGCAGCELELTALNNPYYDMERFGLCFVATPHHADALLVLGPLTQGMVEPLRLAYAAVPAPKLVVAVGDCACDGCVFKDAYGVMGGVATVVPVDVQIGGCPPAPQAILAALLQASGRFNS